MSKPKILELFCGVGGAAMGYHQAGFDVYGVDIEQQPDFPFAFCLGDAISILSRLIGGGAVTFTRPDGTSETLRINDFDAIHASPLFSLGVIRHRYFEVSGFTPLTLTHKKHRGRVAGWRHGEWFDGPYFAVYGEGGGKGTVAQWQDAMGILWTNSRKSIAEAIPPAYARFIGGQMIGRLSSQGHIEALKELAV